LLKEVHITLNEDLPDIDLLALKAATTEPMKDPAHKNALERWVRLLEAVSPPLVAMGRELTNAEAFVARRRKSTKTMQNMMCAMGAVLTIIISLSAWRMMTVASLPQKTLGIGLLLCCLLGFFALIKIWILMLSERLDRYAAENNGPVMNALRKYRITLSDKFIVQYSAAYTTGSGMAALVEGLGANVGADAKNANDSEKSETERLKARNCTQPSANYSANDCRWPVDVCTPPDSLPALEETVKRYCVPLMHDMLDRLQEIKLDVDQYDRALLWRDIADGVDEMRKLVYVQYDVRGVAEATSGGAASAGLTRASAIRILDEEVVPVLRLPTVELSMFRASAPLGGGTTKPSKELCWRSCTDDSSCAVATYDDATKMCTQSNSYSAPIESGKLDFVTTLKSATPVLIRQPPADGNKPLFVSGRPLSSAPDRMSLMPPPKTGTGPLEACRADPACRVVLDSHLWRASPDDSLQLFLKDTEVTASDTTATAADASTASDALKNAADALLAASQPKAFVKTTPEALYREGLAISAINMMRTGASGIAHNLFTVMQRHGYQLSLDANRTYIDRRLAEHYGDDMYAQLSPVVDEVMLLTRDLVRNAVSTRNAKFIEPARLADKVGDATGAEWSSLSTKMQRTLTAVKDHRDHFPSYRNNMPSRLYKSLVLYGAFIAGIAFLVFMVLLFHAKRIMVIDSSAMIRRIMVSICVFVLTIVIAEMSAKKYAVTREHNFDAIDNNGEMLVGGVSRVNKQLVALREVALREKTVAAAADGGSEAKRMSFPALRDVRATIGTYDRCNFVTSSISKMPFPTVDMMLYSIIALLFIGVALFAVARIGPAERVGNVRRLLNAKARLKRGEISNMTEIVRLVECCQPPELVWDMFIWFAIIMLFVVTWWFVFATRDTVDDYESAIAANPDCV
jgi:hypothetical protein